MGKPSALFVDRTYVEQQLATLRSDIITVLEAKFRVVQNDQERIIRLLEDVGGKQNADEKPQVSEAYAWKIEMRRRVDKLVKSYPELYSDFNNVLTRIYRKMRDVYGFVSEQAIKDYKYATGSERASCLEVISEDEKLRSIFEPILSIWRRTATKKWNGDGWQPKWSRVRHDGKLFSRLLKPEATQQTLDVLHITL